MSLETVKRSTVPSHANVTVAKRPPIARPNFLDEITVEHGPVDVLGKFFLKADTAARERGPEGRRDTSRRARLPSRPHPPRVGLDQGWGWRGSLKGD